MADAYEAFDLSQDPQERVDRFDANPDWLGELRLRLEDALQRIDTAPLLEN
jgi:hypothetical protein